MLDEQLYSRQLYVIGCDSMKSLMASRVFVYGLEGPSAEILKNLCLFGVGSITVFDFGNITYNDLEANCFLNENDIGQDRCVTVLSKLKDLNSYVSLMRSDIDILDNKDPVEIQDFCKSYDVIVVVQSFIQKFDQILQLSEICHNVSGKFVLASTLSATGHVFCDFGENFLVKDLTGDEPVSFLIDKIYSDEDQTYIKLVDRHNAKIASGDLIRIVDLKCSCEHFSDREFEIEVFDKKTVTIKRMDTDRCNCGGATLLEVKKPKKFSFKSLKDSWLKPKIGCGSEIWSEKQESERTIHFAYIGIAKFFQIHSRMPKLYSEKEFEEIKRLLTSDTKIKSEIDDFNIDWKLFEIIVLTSSCFLPPINSIVGAVAAQEVIKASSHQFKPISQWFYLQTVEALEVFHGNLDILNMSKIEFNNSSNHRYHNQICLIGKAAHKKIMDQKWFMVGCGAIGCELLKNFAMIGVSCGNGKLVVTDMDSIERSNLSRQFLFRNENTGEFKSECAVKAVSLINSQTYGKYLAHTNRVDSSSENIYNDDFYLSLDGIANALDNVDARKYTDKCAFKYKLCLLESGTLGTQGHSMPIIPNITTRYKAPGADDNGQKIPICTIKSYPYLIQHTIQWARDLFEGLFVKLSNVLHEFFLDREQLFNKLSPRPPNERFLELEKIKFMLDENCDSLESCIFWGRKMFERFYHNDIVQILFTYPPGYQVAGLDFWSSSRKLPHQIVFDVVNETHLSFVIKSAQLRAFIFNINYEKLSDLKWVKTICKDIVLPIFNPDSQLKIAKDDNDEEKIVNSDMQGYKNRAENLENHLSSVNFNIRKINIVEFEKDDDSNAHIDFIYYASKLRALNYEIKTVDRMKTKLIAGRIIPAISTTTSIVSGFISIELYKYALGCGAESYKETSTNLASSIIMLSQTLPPTILCKVGDKNYTEWDIFDSPNITNMSIIQFNDFFKSEYGINIFAVFYENLQLFPKASEKYKSDIELYQFLLMLIGPDKIINPKNIILTILEEDESIENLPPVWYRV